MVIIIRLTNCFVPTIEAVGLAWGKKPVRLPYFHMDGNPHPSTVRRHSIRSDGFLKFDITHNINRKMKTAVPGSETAVFLSGFHIQKIRLQIVKLTELIGSVTDKGFVAERAASYSLD